MASTESRLLSEPSQSSSFRTNVWPSVRHFIGGYFSGCALVAVGHPFDLVKVRLQNDGGTRFKGVLDCVRQTYVREGIHGFYKGMASPLFATGFLNSILFGLQGMTVEQLRKWNGPEGRKTATVYETMLAGAITGGMIATIATPMEGIKCRLQVQYHARKSVAGAADEVKPLYRGPVHCAKEVYRKLGLWRGIYRGFLPVAFCRMSNWAYFGGYHLMSNWLRPSLPPDHPIGAPPPKPSMLSAILSGGFAGFCFWSVCYPVDVIKARIQSAPDVWPPKYNGIMHTARLIHAEAGWRGFFHGFTPCVLRAFPANAACFVAFELIMGVLPE